MQIEDCYYLGKITKKHGFKGSVILHLDTDDPESYNNLESVFVKNDETLVPFFFEQFQPYRGQKFLAKLKDVGQEEVGDFLNKELYLPINTLPKLTGNQFYFHEVIGYDLFNQEKKVGQIKNVIDQSAQAIFSVSFEQKEILIPIVDEWILEVNRESKKITMNLPEGLIEIND